MNRKYIGLGIVVILVVTIILCIFLIPSATDDSNKKGSLETASSGLATTFPPEVTTEPPLVIPSCPPAATTLHLHNSRVNVDELESALKTSCAGIESLELINIEILKTGGNVVPLPKVTLSKLRRFSFDRFMFPAGYTQPSTIRNYKDNLSEEIFLNDLLFLNTKDGQKLTLAGMSSGLGLDFIEVKLNGHRLLSMNRPNGTVRFKHIKKLENQILTSVRNDQRFTLRNLTGHQSNLDVDQILPKATDLSGLYLYYSSLFSSSDATQNLHTFILQLINLTELHLHLFNPPFDTLDTSDLVGLTKLTRFSFQYHGSSSAVLLTHNSGGVTLPGITYLYVTADWGKMDSKFIEAIPVLFPNLVTIIYDGYESAYYDEILYQLLKMPSLQSISFYGYHLFPVKEDQRSKHAEEAQGFLRAAGIAPGLKDFLLTRSSAKARWQGREIRYFEKEGYSRLTQD